MVTVVQVEEIRQHNQLEKKEKTYQTGCKMKVQCTFQIQILFMYAKIKNLTPLFNPFSKQKLVILFIRS